MLPSFGRFSLLAAMLLGLGCSSTPMMANADSVLDTISPPRPSKPSDLDALQKKTFHYHSTDIVVTKTDKSGEVASRYSIFKNQPILHIENGCDPYVLVTEDGHVSSGTNADGGEHPESTGCRTDKRQMYGRVVDVDGKSEAYYIYMYYFPKVRLRGKIETHSFECIVVKPYHYAAFTSWDGGFYKLSFFAGRLGEFREDFRPYFKYVTRTTHDHIKDAYLSTTDKQGLDVPMVLWHQLSEEARRSLNHYDFKTSWRNETVCINDDNYLKTIDAADGADLRMRDA